MEERTIILDKNRVGALCRLCTHSNLGEMHSLDGILIIVGCHGHSLACKWLQIDGQHWKRAKFKAIAKKYGMKARLQHKTPPAGIIIPAKVTSGSMFLIDERYK